MKFFKQKKGKHVFIHIGFMKTGTSAIQSFLKSNDKFLQENNFYFPSINQDVMNYLGFSLLDDIPPLIHQKLNINKEQLYENLIKEINHSKQDNIILSTEAYYLITTDSFLGSEAPSRLFNLFKNQHYTFTIIAFIRRQDEYLESQYNQHVKTHNFWDLYSKDIMTFYEEKKELFKYNLIIDRWAKVFGEENLIVKVYDKRQNSVELFCNILKINLKTVVFNNDNVNKKLNSKSLEFMRIANKYGIDKSTANKNYTLVKLIDDVLDKEDVSDALLSNKNSNNVLRDFYNENVSLSNKYLNGDLSWFLPKINKKQLGNDVPNDLTVEECIQVVSHIWNYHQSNNKK